MVVLDRNIRYFSATTTTNANTITHASIGTRTNSNTDSRTNSNSNTDSPDSDTDSHTGTDSGANSNTDTHSNSSACHFDGTADFTGNRIDFAWIDTKLFGIGNVFRRQQHGHDCFSTVEFVGCRRSLNERKWHGQRHHQRSSDNYREFGKHSCHREFECHSGCR